MVDVLFDGKVVSMFLVDLEPRGDLTSQLPVSRWHEQIGDPTLADGILDRLVHNAHRIEMRGDSMRKNRGKPNVKSSALLAGESLPLVR